MTQKTSLDGGLHRRDFLILGSAATLGIAAVSSADTTGALAILAPARDRFSVGFASPASGETQRLRPAERVSGDSDFLSGSARVTVHGLWRPESRSAVPANVAVTVFHAVGDTTVPFLAWQHSGISSAARVSFTTPVQPDGTLPIGIESSRAFSFLTEPQRRFSRLFRTVPDHDVDLPVQSALAKSGQLCSLGAQGSRGLKLRRGTYFVALGEAQPNWNMITAGTSLNVRSETVLHHGSVPVDFDYLVISVDRA